MNTKIAERKALLLEQLRLEKEEAWLYECEDYDNEGQTVIAHDQCEGKGTLPRAYGLVPLFNNLNFFSYWCELVSSHPTFLGHVLASEPNDVDTQVWKKFESELVILGHLIMHKPTLTIMLMAKVDKKEKDKYKHLVLEVDQQFVYPFTTKEFTSMFPTLSNLVPEYLTDDAKPKEESVLECSNVEVQIEKLNTTEVQGVLAQNLENVLAVDLALEVRNLEFTVVGEDGVELTRVNGSKDLLEAHVFNDGNNNNSVPVYDFKVPVPPPVVSKTGCKDLLVRDVDGERHKMLANSLWSKFAKDLDSSSKPNAVILAKLLKSDPPLAQMLIDYSNRNYLTTMLSTIADPDFKSEDNIFDYVTNANTYSAAINRAPGCWSVFDGATWMLSPNEYNMLSYTFTKVVNLDKNWEYNKEKAGPKTKQYLISPYFECPDSSCNVHLLPYVKNNYAYLWVQAAGYFQKKLDKLIDQVLPSPGIALLNLPTSALNCECFDAYRIKRDKENAQNLSIHMRGRLPKSSIPMKLKNELKTQVYPNYTAFMQGSDGSYIANLLLLDEFAAYKEMYMLELQAARANDNVIFYGKLYNSVLAFRDNGLPLIHDNVDFAQSSKWIEQVNIPVDFIFQNQGYIKAVCFKNYYLHDYTWAIRYILTKVIGHATVVRHDSCLFLYPLHWKVDEIDISTLVPVVGNADNSLSDGCSQDKKLVSKLVQHFKSNKPGLDAEIFFRSLFINSKGKWKEDVVATTALFLKRLKLTTAGSFIHPVPWDFHNLLKDKKILEVLLNWKIKLVMLPCPPSYYCPLAFFNRSRSSLKELEAAARRIALASAVSLKLLNVQFFFDTSVLHFNKAQNENLKQAFALIIEQVYTSFPEMRLRGNAYIPSPKEEVDSFDRYAETATEVGDEIDMEIFAKDKFFKI